nr:hypothetical protein [uncultured Lichenicoccus sp.]
MTIEADLSAMHRGWSYAAGGAVIPGTEPVVFVDPCVAFGFRLWQASRESRA